MYVGRAWYLFSCDHDIIKIRPEFLQQKGNIFHVVQPTMHSTLSVYDICPLKVSTCMCSKLPFTVFPVSRFTVKSFYSLSTFDAAHIRKNNRLSTPAQGQCLDYAVWEQGYHLPSLTLSLTVADVPMENFEIKTLRPHCVYHTDGLGMGLI